jgi:polysaccharide pyruvyl transferase WcaK-like protein/sulfatase maturation enzyme AslB (radical SAM superfamily)
MCFIWKRKLDYQITPEELERSLDSPLFSRVRTVGINGGEPTLRKDLPVLVDVLFRKLPCLKGISLITNALIADKVNARIEEVGKVVQRYHGKFDVMVSLDGVGEMHNRVRGRKGNFDNALRVIDFIQECAYVNSRRLACTVIRDNVYGLHDLLDFAISRDIYIKYRLGVPHKRLYTQDVAAPFALSPQEKLHFCTFLENLIRYYERSIPQQLFYRSLIDQLLEGKPRQAGCDWQHRGATISARGELLYCAVQSKSLGSVVQQNSEALYFGNRDHLADILKYKCGDCTHDYEGIPPARILMRHYLAIASAASPIRPQSLKEYEWLAPLVGLKRRWRFGRRLARVEHLRRSLNHEVRRDNASRRRVDRQRIMICGWYGTETLGDKAILGGLVKALNDAVHEPSYQLVSLHPHLTRLTTSQMRELKGIAICNVEQALVQVRETDLVIFGGGPIMAIDNLAELVALFKQALDRGVPRVIAGCGVGPLGHPVHNRAIRQILNLASFRIYRDELSLRHAARLGVDTSTDLVTEDPSITWLEHKRANLKADVANRTDGYRKLILGLRDWPYHEYAPNLTLQQARAVKQRFEEQLLQALEHLIGQDPTLRIVPYPMCTNHYGGDDRWFYRALFRNQPTMMDRLDYSAISRELSPDEAFEAFILADAALTMRFHALVFALATATPTVAIDYTLGEGKVAALASAHNVPHCALDAIDAELLISQLRTALYDRSDNQQVTPPSTSFSDAIHLALERIN